MKNNSIYPCIWFDGQAQAAARFYCSVFKNSQITSDSQIVVNFELAGQKFMGLNGGPMYQVNPSISFFVVAETETETDEIWNKLSEGGTVLMPLDKYAWSEKYGWIQDRFGVSWQVSLGNIHEVGQKFTPSLMFVGAQYGKAEEAIHTYTSIFKDSSIVGILHADGSDGEKPGAVQHAQFKINNYVLMAMESAHEHAFTFNEGISLAVECQNQEEIDYYWNKLTEGGEESMCGWLKDKYGVSWQIVPEVLGKLMSDPSRSERVVNAFLKMKKFDIATLEQA